MEHVVGALFVREGRFFFGLRAPHKRTYPNCWDMVGDHVEPGETAEQALIREAQEEVGLTPLNLTFVERLIGHAPNLPECANDIFVVREWTGGEPVMLGDEHTELRWFTLIC